MKHNFYDQDDEYCSRHTPGGKMKGVSYRNTDYCVECGNPVSKPKRCRGCGKLLCAFCAKADGMCKDCSRDAYEYVDDDYRNTTRAY